MVENHQEVEIDAPPEDVFEYIADPRNHLKFTPSMMDVSDVGENDVGKEGAYSFKMVGVTLEGRFADVTFDPPHRRSYELSGDIEGTVTWTIEESDGGSHVEYESTLEFPAPDVLETITSPVIARFSRNEIETLLGNLQVLLEESDAEGET
ncbi:MAG: SRPBCC family protein [Haloquadratum sp.]